MKVIYVAGALSGKNDNEVWNNIVLARSHALELWKQGWAVICPHLNSLYMGHGTEDKDCFDLFLAGDCEIITRCDAIYMLPNWKNSRGARLEFETAIAYNLEIIYGEE
jgi:hypothetical protein